jgi:hypothetical protein
MQGAMDLDLQSQLAQLGDSLRNARPDLPWGGKERMRGEQGMGMGDATTALEELADLDDLESALGQDYPGASLDDIDEGAVQRALGRGAVDDVAALQRIERELLEQGYLVRDGRGRLELSPRAVRRVGATALRKVFSKLDAGGRGGHDVRDAGAAGEDDRRQPRVGVRRRAAARRRADGAERRPARWAPRRPGGAAGRGLRGGRDRAPHLGGGRAARRPVLLDGAARHLGHRQVDGAGAALAGVDEVPAGRDPDHRLQRLRPGAHARGAGRAGRAARAGHQPAARAGAGRPAPRQAPGQRAGRARGHRRRAHRAPVPQRARALLLAAAARDARADHGRGGAGDPARRDDQRLHAGRRAAAGRLRRGPRRPQRAAGSSPPTRAGSGSTS